MYQVILTAHNKYASGVYSALKLVAGGAENIRAVDYLENQTYEELDFSLKNAYEELKNYGKVIFITDLTGGTPFYRCVMNFANISDVRIITGMNFSLVYSAVFAEVTDDMDKDIENILKYGKNSISVYKTAVKKEEAIEDDGI